MSEQNQSDEVMIRLAKRAKTFKPELPPKLAALLPFKMQIKELRARNAAYDDIRLILAEEKVMVTLDAIYRFCRVVLGEKSKHLNKARSPKHLSAANLSASPSPENIQETLRERRERFPGPWSRRKRGPRIADPNTL